MIVTPTPGAVEVTRKLVVKSATEDDENDRDDSPRTRKVKTSATASSLLPMVPRFCLTPLPYISNVVTAMVYGI
jgi:hypothetical protein